MKHLFKIAILCTLAALMAITVSAHDCKFEQMRNDASHWEECFECGNYRNAEDHTFENGICTVCGIEKDDKAVHVCSYSKMRNDASHWEECLECGNYRNAEDHTFKDGICTVCGIEKAVDIDSHEHRYVYEKSLYGHWMKCRVCNQTKDSAEHSFDSEKCTDCGMLVPNNPFKDVTDEDWYYTDVLRAYAFGLVNGKNNPDTFCPQDFMTYAEAIKLAACMNELYNTGKVTLTNGTPWYQSYVDYCKASGIISKEYNYNELVTRQGYMEIFAKALPDSALEIINNIPENYVPDVPSSNEYAEAIYKLYRAGIVAGVDSEHNCNPTANIKRCEVAAIISRMMDETQRLLFTKFDSEEEESENEVTLEGTAGKVEINGAPGIVYGHVGEKYDYNKGEDLTIDTMGGELRIERQPAGCEAESYGLKHELYVDVKGGKAPYKYEWYYNGYRNQKTLISNGDYVKDAESAALILSVEKENTLLGASIFCKITDSEGKEITSDSVKVYGPFSMPVETNSIVEAAKKYTLAGRIADGVIKKGDKVSIVRNGKVIAIGIASELQMFDKSIDECAKDDNIGIIFIIEKGVTPHSGDTVIKYKDTHVIDTSDIVN